MPRVGVSSAEQTSGGSIFSFSEGKGEIVTATICNHAIPGYPTSCGYKIGIQPLDANWNPTGDEPIEEFLSCGPTSKFHPGMAASATDNDEALEIGGGKDAGEDDGAEGTCLLSVSGAGPDKKSKSIIFINSLIAVGAKPALLDGYAPSLVGLKATFTQLMLPKGADFKGKRDPTCLIVGVLGKEAGATVHTWPAAQGAGAVAAPKAVTSKAPAKTTAAASTPAATVVVTSEPTAAAFNDDIESVATQMLAFVSESSAGQTMTRQKIGSKLVTLLAKNRIPTAKHKPVKDLIASDWFIEQAEAFGWEVSDGNVAFPAAEAAA